MYLEYYSLERPPFRITPDPALFFTGGAHGRGVVLEALLYAIQSGEGILKVVGEVGSGKTMLCRMLEQRLPDTVEVVYLANPKLTPHDILYAVAFELKLNVDQETPRLVLMQKLQSHLLEQHAANRSVLVIIEEAQSMPLDTLEEIRLFSNLETHQHKLMQIILFGQPELDKNLQDKNIRQLRERITHSFYLSPLTADEVSDYLRHRLQAAGCPAPQIFSKAAEKLIAKASGGLTRRINILADKAMLAAYSESATSTRPRSLGNQLEPTVQIQHVKAAIKDSDYQTPTRISPWALAVVSLLLIIGILSWLLVSRPAGGLREDAVASLPVPTSPASGPAAVLTATVIPDAGLEVTAESPAAEPASEAAAAEPEFATTTSGPESTAPGVAEMELPAESAQITQQTITPQSEPVVLAEVLPQAGTNQSRSSNVAYPEIVTARADAFSTLRESGGIGSYTLQLLTISSDQTPFVVSTLNQLERSGLIADTYVCLTESQDGLLWRIIYGHYPNVDDARASVSLLPLTIRNNQPFVQNINRLQCVSARS
ncbi:MAG: AAA family ATPase [Pseudohongiella sp.]|nr:AAA family ATPase [Pseudohongiella sp.]MDO9519895.1 AAA family ATPase [Pseudohongiella sp.]